MGETLFSESVRNINDGELYNCNLEFIHIEYLSEVLELQKLSTEFMKDKTICLPSSEHDWKMMLGGEGVVVGAFVDRKLIGYVAALFPGNSEANLAKYTDLDPSLWEDTCNLELCYVHPDFQRNSLQITMTGPVIKKLKEYDNWKYILTTVHPFNYASMTDVFLHNIYIVKLRKMYNGLWRYVFMQDYNYSIIPDRENYISVESSDFERQIELLNDGYIGFKLHKDEQNKKFILFSKVLE
jgi:hypothetical protein